MRRAAKVFTIGLLGSALGVLSAAGGGKSEMSSQAAASLRVVRVPDTSLLIAQLDRRKLVIDGRAFDAGKYCNEQSISNPEQIEFYELGDQSDKIVLCTGSADGEENVITVFPATGSPRVRKVAPKKSKHRVSDEVLRDTILRLTR